MANHDDRSGMQTAADLARMAKAAVRIARAAATAGLHGAAVAAAKEAIPFLVKVVIAVLIVLIAVPMVVFTALPNIFFGYESSDTDSVAHMTQQAMTIGGAYMSLEEFEHTQVDSVVTSIVNEYESQGKKIDRIKVVNHFDEDDLIWLIAINSVSHQQDLNTMSAVEIRNFCVSRLTYSPSLGIIGEGDAAETTLTITVEKLAPEKLMVDLGFDAEAQTWAGALYETLKESDAIQKYGPYFTPYQPDYSGDSGYDGEASHGSSYTKRNGFSEKEFEGIFIVSHLQGNDLYKNRMSKKGTSNGAGVTPPVPMFLPGSGMSPFPVSPRPLSPAQDRAVETPQRQHEIQRLSHSLF